MNGAEGRREVRGILKLRIKKKKIAGKSRKRVEEDENKMFRFCHAYSNFSKR